MKFFEKIRRNLLYASKLNVLVKTYLSIQQYRQCALQGDKTGIDASGTVIVSLTTYNKRIHEVYLTIESLFQQTQKAKRIILWLAKDEFSKEEIPLILQKQQSRGLEIRFCEDVRQYKKLIPSLKLFPNHPIITVDDDYIYPIDFIERLLNGQRRYPACVCYYIGARIEFQNSGTIKPYIQWGHDEEKEYTPSILNFSTGAGGVLYPPQCFHEDITNNSLFSKYAPKGDDIWFKAMTLKRDVQYVRIPIECDFSDKFLLLENGQDIALYLSNVKCGENDIQIKDTFEQYGLMEKLRCAAQ